MTAKENERTTEQIVTSTIGEEDELSTEQMPTSTTENTQTTSRLLNILTTFPEGADEDMSESESESEVWDYDSDTDTDADTDSSDENIILPVTDGKINQR